MSFDNLRAGSVYLDRNGKNIPKIFCRVYLPPRLILKTCIIVAGCGWKQGLSCNPNCGEIVEKGRNGRFFTDRALLNEYGEKVNGSLIHANRLAFGRARGYLCIAAAPWRLMHQPSLHERPGTTSRQTVKYNSNA